MCNVNVIMNCANVTLNMSKGKVGLQKTMPERKKKYYLKNKRQFPEWIRI
jgi:hypothetical protein